MHRIIYILRKTLFPVVLVFCLTGSVVTASLQTPASPVLENDKTALLPAERAKMKKVLLTPEDQAWIKQHPTFTIGGYSLPPFIIHDRDAPCGYLVALLKAISNQVGLEPEFSINTAELMNTGLRDGTLDVGMGLIYSAKRDAWLEYSQPSLPIEYAIYTRIERKDITDIASLKGKTVAVIKGSVTNAMLNKYVPEATIIQTKDYTETFQLLSRGKADAVIEVRNTADYYLYSHII
ncbi:MAG: transporter substrate-binding domain-containing protein, partial [Deltaproteobacteria bacterium]|nr:transporter substrate-binding domain-containing protein [Deltaproteobacteria bacterium]